MEHPLRLDDCPHVRVFKVAVRAIRESPILASLVRRWRVWDGRVDDWREPARGEFPCLELLIGEGADQFYGPDGFVGPLTVDVIVSTLGSNQIEPVNLYWAVKRAIYPDDLEARATLHQELVDAGAQGMFLVRFSAPRFMPIRQEGESQYSSRLVGYGEFEVPVVDRRNP